MQYLRGSGSFCIRIEEAYVIIINDKIYNIKVSLIEFEY